MIRPIAVAILAALLLNGCGKTQKEPPPPPKVLVATPLKQRIVDWDDYVGRFESIDAVELRPRVSGYLTKLDFTDGQRVAKGQLLFQIDPRPYRAALAQAAAQTARARATLNNAQVELKRAQALFQAQAGSQQELETRRAAALQAQADLQAAIATQRAAALNVDFTFIHAPIAGRISDRRVAPGNLVTADTTLLTTIVNDDPIRFAFEAPEDLFLKRKRAGPHKVGDEVAIRLGDEPAYHWKGRLEFIDNQLDPNSGVIRGRAVLPNGQHLLTPGLYGHMRLPGTAPYDGLLLPDEAVTSDQERQVVMVVGPDDVVRQKPVEVGPLVSGLRAIRSGIAATDHVVIAGLAKAKPGTKVSPRLSPIRVVKEQRAAPIQEAPASVAFPVS